MPASFASRRIDPKDAARAPRIPGGSGLRGRASLSERGRPEVNGPTSAGKGIVKEGRRGPTVVAQGHVE
jgi:hypothetical protein